MVLGERSKINFQPDGEISVEDVSDLLYILRLRFGDISQSVIETIISIKQESTLERLILVAANVSTLNDFLEELNAGDDSFRIEGEKFNPLGKSGGS